MLLTFYLLTTAVSRLIGGVFGVAGNVASAVIQAVGAVAPEMSKVVQGQPGQLDVSWNEIKQEVLTLLRQTGTAEQQQANEEFSTALERLMRDGEGGATENRQAVVNMLMAQTNMSREEADQTVRRWEQAYQAVQNQAEQTTSEVKQEAVQAAAATAETVSTASFWAFVVMLLGAIVASVGGAFGTPRDVAFGTRTH